MVDIREALELKALGIQIALDDFTNLASEPYINGSNMKSPYRGIYGRVIKNILMSTLWMITLSEDNINCEFVLLLSQSM